MEYNITFFIALIGLGLAIINAIRNLIQQKRMKTSILKLPAKRNLFKEWYDRAKDFTSRMEFTETKEKEYNTIYFFKIRNKDNSDFISPKKQEILFERYRMSCNDAYEICGYNLKKRKLAPMEMIGVKKELSKNYISFPDDMLPEGENAIKNDVLEQILKVAKENGIKKRYLK